VARQVGRMAGRASRALGAAPVRRAPARSAERASPSRR